MKRALVLGALFLMSPIFAEEVIDLGSIVTTIERPKHDKVISSERIQNIKPASIQELLAEEGFLVMATGGEGAMTNVSINGYAGFCVKVYVDGRLANNPTTGEFDWNQLDVNSVEDIKVCYSPQNNDSQFAGASIHIKTTRFSGEAFTFRSEVTGYKNSKTDSIRNSLEYRNVVEPIAFKLNLQTYQAKNEYETRRLITNKGTPAEGYKISLDTEMPLQGTYSLSTYLAISENNYTDSSANTEVDSNVYSFLKVKSNSADHEQTYTIGLNNVRVQYNDSFEVTNPYIQLQHTWYSLLPDLNTTFTLDFQNETHSNKSVRNQVIATNSWTLFVGSSVVDLRLPVVIWWKPLDCSFNPSLTVTRNWFQCSIYKQFVLPTFNQLYYDGVGGHGNPDLKPEQGWGCTVSVQPSFPVYFRVQASMYKNKIRWLGSDKQGYYALNVGKGYYLNPTVGTSHKWSHFWYDLWLQRNWALLADGENKGKQIMWVPLYQGCLSLGANYKGMLLESSLTYIGTRYAQNSNTSKLDPYLLWDMSVTYKLTRHLEVYMKGKNILDERYLYHDNYSAPSRSCTLGFLYRK